jgi:hypothetical protein
VPENLKETFVAMTQELIDCRLLSYERRFSTEELDESSMEFTAKLSHTGGKPILFIDRKTFPHVPHGTVEVVVDGQSYYADFVKIAVNVMRKPAERGNVLPEVMRSLFGPHAGLPGTDFHVRFRKEGDHWEMMPEKPREMGKIIELNRFRLPYFRELRAACGAFRDGQFTGDPEDSKMIDITSGRSRVDPGRHFVLKASGTSMDGGGAPIKNGDLVMMEWMTAASPPDVHGQICLVRKLGVDDSEAYVLKRILRKEGDYYLKSENPPDTLERVDYENIVPMARFVEVVRE